MSAGTRQAIVRLDDATRTRIQQRVDAFGRAATRTLRVSRETLAEALSGGGLRRAVVERLRAKVGA